MCRKVGTEQTYRTIVSPSALGPVAGEPDRNTDHLSANYLIALRARVVREVGDLVRGATAAGKRMATLSANTEIRFRSPTERAAFGHELTEAITVRLGPQISKDLVSGESPVAGDRQQGQQHQSLTLTRQSRHSFAVRLEPEHTERALQEFFTLHAAQLRRN